MSHLDDLWIEDTSLFGTLVYTSAPMLPTLERFQYPLSSIMCTGALAISRSFFGSGFGRIHLDNLECDGDEERLIDCDHNGELNHNCLHSEDAGVICQGSMC